MPESSSPPSTPNWICENARFVCWRAKRWFLSGPFVRHEVCPKALLNKRRLEYRFYHEYFGHATMFNDVRLILERASRESARSGINALDSLHIAAAHLLRADEFITTEKPGRSVYRTSLVNVVYLFN